MFDLTGKVAWVVGGAGYLGLPVCRGLVEQGASLALADLDEARVQRGVAEVREAYPAARVSGCVADVGDEAAVKRCVDGILREFGRLDIAVNATYGSIGKLVAEITGAEFDAANHLNLTAAVFFAREAARAMTRGGSIVLYSSMYGLVAPDPRIYNLPMKPNPIEYGMGKAAVIQMAKYLATCWAGRGIRVNAVAPGPFPHPGLQAADPEFVRRLALKVPLGRIGRPEETAGAVVYLASDEASYVTGQTIVVDGGWTVW
jgi:NAD(P)-dependent dehydrogenase (short-subunit alcohol dehydrogenase family)